MRNRAFLVLTGGLAAGVAIFLGCGDDAANDGTPSVDAGNAAETSTPVVVDSGSEGDASTFAIPWEWVGVIGTGQSLSIGATAGTLISTEPSANNGKLVDNGPAPKYPLDGGGAQYAIAPLTERIRTGITGYGDSQYPNNIAGETPHSGMASELTALAKNVHGAADYVSMHSVVGWSGNPLVNIDKQGGKRAYPGSIQEVRAFKALADAAGKTYGVGGIILTHGESDANNAAYGSGLKTFISDYNADIKAITGQTRDIPLLVSQQSVNDRPTSSAVQVWRVGTEDPRIICAGPKYQYEYNTDQLHFKASGYLRLGEKYAEIFDAVVNQGKAWKPVQPRNITRADKVITIVFDVPEPPLQWDKTLLPPHQTLHAAWAAGRGFEVLDGTTEAVIASTELTGPDTVTITLAASPADAVTVGYATTQDGAGNQGGQVAGYRGQLADSDPLVGYDEESLEVTLTQGSAAATLGTGASFAKRALRDIVTVDGAPPSWTVIAASDGTLTMSEPWPGTTGVKLVKIHHDQRNYAVHFSQSL